MTVSFTEEDEELSGVVARVAEIDAGAAPAPHSQSRGEVVGMGRSDLGLLPRPLDDSDLGDDDFVDEQTPVMGVRVVVGRDGEVESVYAVDSELPPARVEAMSGPVRLPPPPKLPGGGGPPPGNELPRLDSEPHNAIPLTRRRTGHFSSPPAPYASGLTRALLPVELWLPPLVAALLASATTAALMWLLGVR